MSVYQKMLLTSTTSNFKTGILCDIWVEEKLVLFFNETDIFTSSKIIGEPTWYSECLVITTKHNIYKFTKATEDYKNPLWRVSTEGVCKCLGFSLEETIGDNTFRFNRPIEYWEAIEWYNTTHQNKKPQDYIRGEEKEIWTL